MPRGRPRTTDPAEVLGNVMQTFWKQGYAGTSINDLVAASGMKKPGLYNTFGDKETLYTKALDLYAEKVAEPMLAEVANGELTVREAIGGFLERIASTACNPDGPKGCLIALSLIDIESLPDGLKAAAKARNDQRRKVFLERLNSSLELSADVGGATNATLANFYSAQALTVTTLARAGEKIEDIKAIIEQSLKLIPAQ